MTPRVAAAFRLPAMRANLLSPRWRLTGLLGGMLAGMLTLAACSHTPPDTLLPLPDGRTLSVRQKPGNGPVLVFQSGLGDGWETWRPVWDRLPPGQAAWAYDRPGYGGSPWLPGGRRDATTVARELHQALRAAGVKPPYVLVGHSLGGLYQAAFARLYPDDVAGLLLLEPTHPEHWATLQREVPALAAVVSALRVASFSPAMRAEFDAQADGWADLRTTLPPQLPARLLARSRYTGAEAGAFEAMARRLQADWVRWLPGLTHRDVDGTGHYLQRDRPDVVLDEALRLVAAVRRSPAAADQ